MSTVSKKKKARGSKRKTLNKSLEKAKSLIDKNAEAAEIVATRDTLLEKFKEIQILDEDIFNLLLESNEDELDAEEEETTNLCKHFKHQINIINAHLSSKEETASVTSRTTTGSSNNVRLPKISIKVFDGEPCN